MNRVLSKFFKLSIKEKLRSGAGLMLVLFLLAGVVSAGAVENIPYSMNRFRGPSRKTTVAEFKLRLRRIKRLFDQVEIKGLTDKLQTNLKTELSALISLDKKVSGIFTESVKRVHAKNLSSKVLKRLSYRSKMAFIKYRKQFRRLISISVKLLTGPVNKPPEFYHSIIVRLKKLHWLEKSLPKESFDLKKLPVKAPVFGPRTSFDPIKKKLKILPSLTDYLIETPETRLSPQIEDLADKLDHDPSKILGWVNLNIRNFPVPGSLWGARGCLQEKAGSPLDRASLLVALLRASKIPCRYVFGMTQAGGGEELSSSFRAGMPVNGKTIGRIWVEARIMGKEASPVWRPLVLSSFSPGPERPLKPDFKLAEKGVEQRWKLSRKLLKEALTLPPPALSFPDRSPAASNSLTAGKPPFKVIGQPIKTAAAPESLRYSVRLRLIDEQEGITDLSWSPLDTLFQEVSLVYLPADRSEVEIIKLLGEMEEKDPKYVSPSYLMRLKAYLIVGREKIVSGPISTLGSEQILELTVTGPEGFREKAVHNLRVGMHSYLAFNFGNILAEPEPGIIGSVTAWVMDKLMDMGWYDDMSGMGTDYLRQTRLIDRYLAAKHRVSLDNLFSESLVSQSAKVETLLGVPVSFAYNGTQMDVQKELLLPAGEQNRPWIRVKASVASALEEKVLRDRLKGPAYSTLSLLKDYLKEEVSVLHITSENLSASLPRLKYPRRVVALVKQTVLCGGEITIPSSVPEGFEIGYIVTNSQGDAGYFMSNGLGAGQTGMVGSMNTSASLTLPKRTKTMLIVLVLVLGVMVLIVVLAS